MLLNAAYKELSNIILSRLKPYAKEIIVRKIQETVNGVSFNTKTNALIAYADDIVILGSNKENIKNTTKELITKALEMGLVINDKKT